MAVAPTIDKQATVIAPYEGIFTAVQRAEDTGVVTWKATVSDDGVDKYASRMTTDLHEDFIRNWKAGEPCFLTLAHFYGASRIGEATALYRDGRKLKAEGRFFTDSDDPFIAKLARAAADKAGSEINQLPSQRTIKTSIGFNPTAYVDEDLDVIGYTRGTLPEITMTTLPANSRTDFGGQEMTKRALDPARMKDDAAGIVGDELAEAIAAKDEAMRQERAGEPEEKLLYRAVTVDSDELPANVKKMDDAQKKVWVKTYNAATKNGADDADAKKAANAFVKNMNAKQDKSGGAEGGNVLYAAELTAQLEAVRAGRKIQGKKLAALEEAANTIAEILAWAKEGDEEDEGDRAVYVRARMGDLEDGAALGVVAEARYMELTGAESLVDIIDYAAMRDYLYTLSYSLQDLIMASLNPDNELSTPERMANIDASMDEYKALVNGILSQYFSNDGRSAEEGDDNMAMNKDVKPTDKGTATVKPEGESEGRTKFDDVADKIRQHIIDGDREAVQTVLNDELAPALEESLGVEAETMSDAVAAEIDALKVQNSALVERLDTIIERLDARPAEPEVRSDPPAYRPAPPRRQGFTRPPATAHRSTAATPTEDGPKRFSIAEAANLKTGSRYP